MRFSDHLNQDEFLVVDLDFSVCIVVGLLHFPLFLRIMKITRQTCNLKCHDNDPSSESV